MICLEPLQRSCEKLLLWLRWREELTATVVPMVCSPRGAPDAHVPRLAGSCCAPHRPRGPPTPPHHRAQAIFWLGFFVPIHMVLLRAIATDAQHSTPALRGSRVWRAFQIVSVIHVAMYWVRACVIAH